MKLQRHELCPDCPMKPDTAYMEVPTIDNCVDLHAEIKKIGIGKSVVCHPDGTYTKVEHLPVETIYAQTGVLRRINNMFHVDTEGYLVKSSNGQRVPDDEPVVILRARDRLALPILWQYRRRAIEDNCTDWFVERLDPPIQEFERFQREHPERMKQPGITRGK